MRNSLVGAFSVSPYVHCFFSCCYCCYCCCLPFEFLPRNKHFWHLPFYSPNVQCGVIFMLVHRFRHVFIFSIFCLHMRLCVCVCAQFVYIIYYWIVEIVVTVSFRTVVHLDSNALSLIIIIVNSRYKRNRHRIAAAQTIFNKKRICDRSNRNTQRSYSIQISEWVTENHINLLNTRQFISCLGKFKKHVLKQFWAANGCARERVPLLLMLPSFNELDIRIALTAIVCFNAKDSQLKILSIGE